MEHSKIYGGCGSSRPVFSVDNDFEEHLIVKEQESQLKVCPEEQPSFFTLTSSLIHLAVLGIFGVLSRYLLEKLFGPDKIGLTSDDSFLYTDLPPSMVGSFLMGWFGIVFKGDIAKFSPELAVGLSIGYLGSLIAFSGWNQKMIELSFDGLWIYSIIGFFLGWLLAFISFKLGVLSATYFKRVLSKTSLCFKGGLSDAHNGLRHVILTIVMLTVLALQWGFSAVLLLKDFNGDSATSYLWLGCIVGPVGVWIRFYLAKLNGKGLGRTGIIKWMPFGTLIANVVACCLMAALATFRNQVNDKHFDTMAKGIQLGLCGCLNTFSTFIAEFGSLIEKGLFWQGCVYAFMTIFISFSLGTLIYSVPIWSRFWS